MPISFLPEAAQEMIEAALYYQSQAIGLGMDYLSEIDHAVKSIETSPHTWPIIQGDLRRRLMRRFPYGVLYRIEPEEIVIVAISHLRKRPNYWKKRVE